MSFQLYLYGGRVAAGSVSFIASLAFLTQLIREQKPWKHFWFARPLTSVVCAGLVTSVASFIPTDLNNDRNACITQSILYQIGIIGFAAYNSLLAFNCLSIRYLHDVPLSIRRREPWTHLSVLIILALVTILPILVDSTIFIPTQTLGCHVASSNLLAILVFDLPLGLFLVVQLLAVLILAPWLLYHNWLWYRLHRLQESSPKRRRVSLTITTPKPNKLRYITLSCIYIVFGWLSFLPFIINRIISQLSETNNPTFDGISGVLVIMSNVWIVLLTFVYTFQHPWEALRERERPWSVSPEAAAQVALRLPSIVPKRSFEMDLQSWDLGGKFLTNQIVADVYKV